MNHTLPYLRSLDLKDHTVSTLALAVAAAHIVQWCIGDRWIAPYPGEQFEVGPILFDHDWSVRIDGDFANRKDERI